MGTGHIMRTIALAQAWGQNGGSVVFLCAQITPDLEKRIKDGGFRVDNLDVAPGDRDDLEATRSSIDHYSPNDPTAPVVLDGYQFSAGFQRGLKKAGCRLLAVDDYGHADFYHADFVLNQNIYACESIYDRRSDCTRLLLGPKYSLLRREFSKLHGWKRRIAGKAIKVLVTLGGADADNVTKKVIDALAGSPFEMKVAIGGCNPHLPSLFHAATNATKEGTVTELVVNPSDMPSLMEWADMAIAAGGSTCWELALAGLPPLLIVLADNQEKNAHELERRGFGIFLGRDTEFDPCSFRATAERLAGDQNLRALFASRGKAMVDGLGAARVAALLAEVDLFEFRQASEADFRLLWELANNPGTRANSFDSSAIPWETHCTWCREKLADPRCVLWIVSTAAFGNVGCIRFDDQSGDTVVSLSLFPQARGKGLGPKIIKQACSRIFENQEVSIIHALIKPANQASKKAFEMAGFQWNADILFKGQQAKRYLLSREAS